MAVFDLQGAHQWSHGYGDEASLVYGHEVAAAPNGQVWVTGGAVGTVDFGGGALSSTQGSYDADLAKNWTSGHHEYGSFSQCDPVEGADIESLQPSDADRLHRTIGSSDDGARL